ncbi:hypothetical protein QNO00_08470 [Arthrobacter sp. zg-Y1219]|nr:hypothetical protein [Arthrobacter sp. zg-Y1219]MDK1360298.1 hypothetical protein [Arthrobacter sp. zg-Y1219]
MGQLLTVMVSHHLADGCAGAKDPPLRLWRMGGPLRQHTPAAC